MHNFQTRELMMWSFRSGAIYSVGPSTTTIRHFGEAMVIYDGIIFLLVVARKHTAAAVFDQGGSGRRIRNWNDGRRMAAPLSIGGWQIIACHHQQKCQTYYNQGSSHDDRC